MGGEKVMRNQGERTGRNPKTENRRPKEGRNPRAEWADGGLTMRSLEVAKWQRGSPAEALGVLRGQWQVGAGVGQTKSLRVFWSAFKP